MGLIVARDESSFFGIWDELLLETNRRLGHVVALRTTKLGIESLLTIMLS